jgi:hypothetical protein
MTDAGINDTNYEERQPNVKLLTTNSTWYDQVFGYLQASYIPVLNLVGEF